MEVAAAEAHCAACNFLHTRGPRGMNVKLACQSLPAKAAFIGYHRCINGSISASQVVVQQQPMLSWKSQHLCFRFRVWTGQYAVINLPYCAEPKSDITSRPRQALALLKGFSHERKCSAPDKPNLLTLTWRETCGFDSACAHEVLAQSQSQAPHFP